MALIVVEAHMPILPISLIEMEYDNTEEYEEQIKELQAKDELKYAWTKREINTGDIRETFEYKGKKNRTIIRFYQNITPIMIQEDFNNFLERKSIAITEELMLSQGHYNIEYIEASPEESVSKP